MSGERPLSIADVARRTGVPAATLRAWEARFGFPSPGRDPGGRRTYAPEDAAAVEAVVRLRAGGLALPAAIVAARDAAAAPPPSIHAAVRAHGVAGRTLGRRSMLALSRAVEDAYLEDGRPGVLVGAFQEHRFFGAARHRWTELGRSARAAVVLAHGADEAAGSRPAGRRGSGAPAAAADPPPGVHVVDLPATSRLRREWGVLCVAPGCTAGLAGLELLPGAAGGRRRFDAVWTTDPAAVRSAAEACAAAVDVHDPASAAALRVALAGLPAVTPAEPRQTADLLARVVGHVDGWLPA